MGKTNGCKRNFEIEIAILPFLRIFEIFFYLWDFIIEHHF